MDKEFQPFGKYILLEKLASGGMAEIFLAKSTGANGIGKFFAIKKILPQFSNNSSFIDMFKDEAKITVNLNHGNIVPIFEFGVEQEQFYLVMDYIEGRNLRQFLNFMKKNNQSFSIDQIVFMCKEVSRGLDHAHRCLDGTTGKPLNIIHRDISPQNIMLSFEGELKIVDFGIAKAESQVENTKAGTLKGKFSYMSPEQAEGLPIDLRTDVFSLGIILWELLAGTRLFSANNEIKTLRKITDCQVPSLRKINPAIPAELERIVNKALAKDRNLRYQTSAALNRDLSRFLNINYPEFSVQDFSALIKSMYATEISENRKKLISYSQVSTEEKRVEQTETLSSNMNNKMQGFESEEKPTTPPPAPQDQPNHTATFEKKPPKKLILNNDHQKPKSQGFADATLPNQSKKPANLLENSQINVDLSALKPKVAEKQRSTSINTSSGLTNPSFNRTHTNIINRSQVYYQKSPLKKILFASAMVVLIATAGLFLFKSKKASSLITQITKTSKPPEKGRVKIGSTGTPTKVKKPVVKTLSLIVNSDPIGAQILVNGQATNQATPAKINYSEGKPFTLSLIKSGYNSYERKLILRKNESLNIPLLTLNQGFIDINVLNAGPNTRIYINGNRISDPLPIRQYAVPADKKLTITAEDPFRQTFDKKNLSIGKNKKKTITLLLRNKDILKRRPTNQ